MLTWSLVNEESKEYSQLADAVQLTLFAVSKSATRTRLISWPRVQNDALPDPPYTYVPDPSLFEAIKIDGNDTSAFFLDIANMFHNITVPVWLSRLFPMNQIYARELDDDTLQRMKTHLPQLYQNENQLLRPCQATMPMGFKWAAFIAHSFVAGCLDQAYKLFRTSRFAPIGMQRPHILHAERAPFQVITAKPIVLHIIDDVTFVATGWSDDAIKAWHKITRPVLALNGLPINESKSCRLEHVEKESIPFIGCHGISSEGP